MKTHVLGVPRIGAQRELKFALESFWAKKTTETQLQNAARDLRATHQSKQSQAGLDFVAVGDFSLYDQMLDMAVTLGALPSRFGFSNENLSLENYFALARGNAAQPALEMTKWFNTNYHYLVPELSRTQTFACQPARLLEEINETIGWGRTPKPVIIGPLSFLYLSKLDGELATANCDCSEHTASHNADDDDAKLALLPALIHTYIELLSHIEARGLSWVQIDEPILALDLSDAWLDALHTAYVQLSKTPLKILLATYFGDVSEHAERLGKLPIAGLHIDLHSAPEQLNPILEHHPAGRVLSIGAVNGRNIWRSDVSSIATALKPVHARLQHDLWIGSSCSLLHCPIDLRLETTMNEDLKSRLSFAWQKIDEIVAVKHAITHNQSNIAQINAPKADQNVAKRLSELTPADAQRNQPHAARAIAQKAQLNLPLFPTTTIGSFPQTVDIRHARSQYKQKTLSNADYSARMQAEIASVIREQEQLDIDVLVHGEAERNDMVEYFGEHLNGYAFTQHGWVQSFGSRCVKPPIIHSDVSRPEQITVKWARYAQSLTNKPVKGMLTGPITMLQWSFVREDQPRSTTALQIALALRDEVLDLEKAGIQIIQIDEPALREGLPLKQKDWDDYLNWSVHAFCVAANGVKDCTQIHTHMCYAEFKDILPAISAMDADVITIETSRSHMALLNDFQSFAYPNQIGPGVYDIHSPRVPSIQDIKALLNKALTVIPAEQLWVNPDCGLKTRAWPETRSALEAMVCAAKELREQQA